jgi:hypothetical protein
MYIYIFCVHVFVCMYVYIYLLQKSNLKYLFIAITLSIHRNVIAGYCKRRKNNLVCLLFQSHSVSSPRLHNFYIWNNVFE